MLPLPSGEGLSLRKRSDRQGERVRGYGAGRGVAAWKNLQYRHRMAVDVFQDRTGQDRLIKVVASVTLLATEKGGRSGPIRGSYRPNHNFFGPDNREMTIGSVDLPTNVDIQPGRSMEVIVTFWCWPGLAGEIYPGREWSLQEGLRVVGTGKVIKVIEGSI